MKFAIYEKMIVCLQMLESYSMNSARITSFRESSYPMTFSEASFQIKAESCFVLQSASGQDEHNHFQTTSSSHFPFSCLFSFS